MFLENDIECYNHLYEKWPKNFQSIMSPKLHKADTRYFNFKPLYIESLSSLSPVNFFVNFASSLLPFGRPDVGRVLDGARGNYVAEARHDARCIGPNPRREWPAIS